MKNKIKKTKNGRRRERESEREKSTIGETNLSSERLDLLPELILDEIDAHGDQDETQEYVKRRYVQIILVAGVD